MPGEWLEARNLENWVAGTPPEQNYHRDLVTLLLKYTLTRNSIENFGTIPRTFFGVPIKDSSIINRS